MRYHSSEMYIPEGYGTVFPYIFASDAAAYLSFLERAFGAQVIGRDDMPDGTVANARVRIGTTSFMVSEAGGQFEPSRASFYIYVEDADQTHRDALACGAEDIHAPRAMDYGDHQGGVTDPSGNIWWISTRTAHEPYD